MHLIEAAWIRPLKKDRPEFRAESRAICSVKLMFYANGQLLELVDETGVDSGDGSLVIIAILGALVIGVHVVAGTAVDERALGERIFVADGEGVALKIRPRLLTTRTLAVPPKAGTSAPTERPKPSNLPV